MKFKLGYTILTALSMLYVCSAGAATTSYSFNGTVYGWNDDTGSVSVSLTYDSDTQSIVGGSAFVGGFNSFVSNNLNFESAGNNNIDFIAADTSPETDTTISLNLYGNFYNWSPSDYGFDNRTSLTAIYLGSHLNEFSVDIDTTTITVNSIDLAAVPVPAAVWLFASGLIGLIGIARRKNS